MKENALIKAGMVLGLGFGGFADGIVLHQILDWHHTVCSTPDCQSLSIEQLKHQNAQDGFFHLATWIISLTGTVMLFHAAQRRVSAWSGRVLFGAMLAGWGLFNFSEGIINHQMLGIHHVLPGSHQLLWDMLFLASGVFFVIAGLILTKSKRQQLLLPCPPETFLLLPPSLHWIASASSESTH